MVNYYFLRRHRLGKVSCEGIRDHMAELGKTVTVYRNDVGSLPQDGFCFRWGCTSTVPHGTPVFNKSDGIHFANAKKTSRIFFSEKGLAPRTWTSPLGVDLSDPVIVRPSYHAQGRNLAFCKTKQELMAAFAKFNDPYVSSFVDKVAEYRVFVCQGRAVWVANKIPADKDVVAWNVARGGVFENVRWKSWPLNVVDTAIKAFNYSGLDFGGVDVMVDKDDRAYVLEINSAPSQTSSYRQQCVAKAFNHVIENGREHIPLGSHGYYLRYIHPALDSNAIVS